MSGRRWWRRRRVIAAGIVVVLVLAVRAALPLVLRSVLESQANALLDGRVRIADVDLWLLQGAVAIDGFELAPASAPSQATPETASGPPRVAFRRLLIDISWLPLLRHTVQLDEIALDGPEIDVERQHDGTMLVPALRPPDPAVTPPAEAPPAAPSQPWNVIVGAARLRDGTLALVDRVPEPEEKLTLNLQGLELLGFRLLHDDAGAAPGTGTIEAHFGDGALRLETSLATRADGFAVIAAATLDNLPLDHLNVHAPQVGWSDFRGRLDGKIDLHMEPNALPIVGGTIALRDVQVDVPGEEEPALAWRRFDLDVERIDLAEHAVAVRRVALDGAGILVRPLAMPPLPLLPRTPTAAASSGAADAAADAVPASGEPEPAWTWSVGTVEIADTMAKVFLQPPPLEIGIVAAKVDGLSSVPASRASAALELREGPGTVKVVGDFAIAPLAANLQLGLDALALERYAVAAGVTPPVLRHGNLGADLKVAFGDGPTVVSGQMTLADLDVAPPAGEDFALAWKKLDIGIREVRVPAAGAAPAAAPGGAVQVALARIALDAPKVRLTRAADGILLPAVSVAPGAATAGEGAAAATPADAAATPAPRPLPGVEPAAPPVSAAAATPPDAKPAVATGSTASAPVELTVDELKVTGGEVAILDRTVQPFYRGKLAAIELVAQGLAYPSNRFRDVRFSAQAPGGTPLEVRAQQKGNAIEVTAQAKGLALPQLNPYVTGAAGYSITSGTFTLASKLRLGEDGYQSESDLAFDDLDVAGAEGDSLFADRFGVPLSLALALLRDVSGRIALSVPVRGDRSGSVRPELAPIVAEALSRALINALASPLKLLGALSLDGDKVTAFAPEPIAFAAGRAVVDDSAWWRVEQLAGVLAASPALRLELVGSAGPDDVRALQEAAVLADLQADQGVWGGLRNLASRGTRNVVRDALLARAAGRPGELDADDAAKLEEWVAAKTVTDDDLRALALARQQRLQAVLVEDYGVAAARIVLLDPAPDAAAGAALVRVQVAARG